eukprot:9040357-Lingulodinium_polyedra.AAC.1
MNDTEELATPLFNKLQSHAGTGLHGRLGIGEWPHTTQRPRVRQSPENTAMRCQGRNRPLRM